MSGPSVTLAVREAAKSYAAPVLRDVSLDLHAGEVHALIGENGAGKSTLAGIMSGVVFPDGGTMAVRGAPYAPATKAAAEARGIGIVLQEPTVIGTLTVGEQVVFGAFPHRLGLIDRAAIRVRARDILTRVELGDLDPDRPMSSLGVAERQLVTIAIGLARPYDVLILDEPTAALSERQADILLAQIARRKSAGAAVVYISHRLEEVLRIADRISVMRDGRLVATVAPGETSPAALVALMVGREVQISSRARAPAAEIVLRVTGLRRPPAVQDVSFELRRGEILGLAGLMGSGRTETVRALCGADRAVAGRVELEGRTSDRPFARPRAAARAGLALVTENRKDEGLFLPLALAANVSVASLPAFAGHGFVRRRAESEVARGWISRLGIAARSVTMPVEQLSGGNQQKVVLAKWLQRAPRILVCDEPTKGIDIAARFEIHRVLLERAHAGTAILVVSSELAELFELCHRIVVLSRGHVTGTFERNDFDQEAILTAALARHGREERGGERAPS